MSGHRALIPAACVAAVACLLSASSALGLIYTYENTTSGAIANSSCLVAPAGGLDRTFTVADSFTVATIALGLNVSHADRGDLRVTILAPGGSSFQAISTSGDNDNDYDILLSTNTEGALDDGDDDPVAEPYYSRLVFVAGVDFYTGNSAGTWTVRLCDPDGGSSPTFNRAKLILSSAASTTTSATSTVTYDWGANGNNVAFVSATVSGVTLSQTSVTDFGGAGLNTTYPNLRTSTGTLSTHTGYYSFYMDAATVLGNGIEGETIGEQSTFGFSVPVRDLTFTWNDIDFLSGDFEDFVRVLGRDANGNPVPHTIAISAGHELVGDSVEGDTAVDNSTTDATATFRFEGPVSSLRFDYMHESDPATSPGDQTTGVSDFTFVAFDYGDAPNSYGTQLAGGARHVLGARALYLGANRPDGESDGQPAADATTDDTTAVGGVGGVDDEDGVTFSSTSDGSPNLFRLIATVTGTNNTGTAAMLCGYLDGAANATVNGTFDRNVTYTAGQVGTSNPTVGAGNEELCIRVNTSGSTSVSLAGGSNPATASCTGGTSFSCTLTWNPNFLSTLTTYARFRLTTDAAFFSNTSPSPTGAASDGEIEDFQLNVGPTRATVDGVKLESTSAEELLAELGAGGMSAAALARLRSELDPDGDGRVAVLRWQTLQERGTAGFDVERRTAGGAWQRLNGEMLPGLVVSLQGGEYLWIEPELSRGVYEYRLVEHEAWGTQWVHGPYRLRLSGKDSPDRSISSAKGSAGGGLQWWPWRSLGARFAGRGRSAPEPNEAAVAERLRTRAARERAALRFAASSSSSGLEAQGGGAGRLVTGVEGWYGVTLARLSSVLGTAEGKLRLALASGNLELSVGGKVAPYRYQPGEDAFYFVGVPYETLETRSNAYQVRLGNGVQMSVANGKGPAPGAVGVFRDRYVAEQEVLLLPWVNREEASDPWYWDYTYAPGTPEKSVTFDLPTPASSGSATLRVALRGASETGAGADHFVTLSVNGQPVPGQVSWDGFGLASLEISFDQSLLAGNERVTVTVHAQAAGGAPYSMVLVDDIEVSYWRRTTARDGSLWLRGAGTGVATVDGFASPGIRVIEMGRSSTKERRDVTIAADGRGGWQASFKAGGGDYLVTDRAKAASAEIDVPSNLRSPEHRAQYLVIAPASLAQGAEALARYRSRRFTTEIVWLQDIYDEFSFGRTDSAAIESFLDYARWNWKQAPRHVVLLGRGTLDHRNLLGYGESLIPLRMAATPWGIYSSDARYADVNGDRRPEYSLGRIQAMTNEQVMAYVAKLSAYESTRGGGTVAVVADNPDDGGDFHANGDETAAAVVSYGLAAEKLYHPIDPVRDRLLSGWSQRAFSAVVYDGHGSATQLASEDFLNVGDVPALANGAAAPVFAAWTCAAGDSTVPGVMGLADSLVLSPGGGAIAAVAPAGLSLDQPAHRLSLAFLEALLGRLQSVGSAVQWAHERGVAEGLAPWMLDIYLVSGDPAVEARR